MKKNNVIASVTIDFHKQLQEYGMEPQKDLLIEHTKRLWSTNRLSFGDYSWTEGYF